MASEPSTADSRPFLERFLGFLRKKGVPVGAIVISGGRLLVRIGDRAAPLDIHVGPPDQTTPFRWLGPYALGYSGAQDLDELQRTWVELVAALLQRSQGHLPELLAAPGAVGLDDEPLELAIPMEFPFASVELSEDPATGGLTAEVLVRLTARCNQDCPYCSAPPPLPDPPAAQVLRLIDRVAAAELPTVVSLTGGEPSLRRELPAIMRHALAQLRRGRVHVQTNAVGFAAEGRLDDYPPPSPNLRFFVSFHAADEAMYDAATGSKGQYERAIQGIRNLLAAGYDMTLNCVVNRINVDHIVDWVAAIPELFPDGRPLLHFSVTMCPEHRPSAPDTLVRYKELAPQLEQAAARARELGLPHDPLQGSTHASIPACLLDEEWRRVEGRGAHIGAHETGYEDYTRIWVKAERCRTCAADAWCLGLPRPYARKFGLDELEPIS